MMGDNNIRCLLATASIYDKLPTKKEKNGGL